ncbi:phosphoenolpyruvate carboxylase [Nocardioides solisilvae]|uniref:phosphoenolpyruvate carboxylase n=1 Tax=Nocardioides solisilvae TaxID=1542435 RepID=UPI000D74C04B|nr:phosphoenolpyruvate carboxylase [Nocardioides solisilvae]
MEATSSDRHDHTTRADRPAADRLADDVALLRRLQDAVLVEAGAGDVLEVVRDLLAAVEGAGADHVRLAAATDHLAADQLEQVARALTVHFHLVNLAESRHRVRVLREGGDARDSALQEAATDPWPALGREGEPVDPGIFERLRIHPVLTAHPTEARRRAVAAALRRIGHQLDRHDDPLRGPAEQQVALRRLQEELEVLWRTAHLRTTRPTPYDEVRTAMAVFDDTLLRLVPRLYRSAELAAGVAEPGTAPPVVAPFVRFGSWIGGDRDGNPFVTAEVTRQTLGIQAEQALRVLAAAVERVGRTLTLDAASTPPSRALRDALAAASVADPAAAAEIAVGSPDEPHRQLLLHAARRVQATRRGEVERAYRDPGELLADLRLAQESLAAAGAHRAAYGELQHLVWQVETFGFHLAELEVRQHSAVHAAVLAELLGQVEDVGDPVAAARDAVLLDRLATDGWPEHVEARSEKAQEVLNTLRVVAWAQERWGERSCGRYVVSFSQQPGDLVAVRALARLAVGERPLRLDVVPLFETGDDLRRCTEVLDGWWELSSTRRWASSVDHRVEVMVGYSDSSKDVGPVSATLGLYDAQARLAAWAGRRGVELTLFHGRGGSLGRGGGPVHRAILAQPPGSVDLRFKVTEQGEVVFARYGDVTIGQRHLERVTAAVLRAATSGNEERTAAAAARYDDLARRLDEASHAAYRALVDVPGFADVVALSSPLEEIGELRMGSRPVRRSGADVGRDLADLRAIPWVFAWSQTRANVPGWFGLGSALAAVGDVALLREAAREWPLLGALLEVAEMSLAKSDRRLAERFLALGGSEEVTRRVLDEMDLTRRWLLDVLDQDELLAREPGLARAVAMRTGYVDALSVVQLRALRELRAATDEASQAAWRRVLLVAVNGVAAGLQNTG